ncbi:hypothetical protein OQA88_13389 [Cercophora sp. LCS_1]
MPPTGPAAATATSKPPFPPDPPIPSATPKPTQGQGTAAPPPPLQSQGQIEPAPSDFSSDSDEFALTDPFADDGAARSSTSVTSSIYAHTFENGRRYQHFKHGRYPIPNDDDELDREDMKHAMLLELTDGRLYYAPLGEVRNVLDVGTGTGIWAIDMGDRFPGARVRGIDISPVQPVWVPPNVDFLVDDCEGEDEWIPQEQDFVHLRYMVVVLRQVGLVLQRAFTSLKPGGWIELQELCAEPLCDDGTMRDDDPVKYMYDLAGRAFSKFGMNVTLPKNLGPMLTDAGFTNVQCVVKKVPIGVWAKDKTLRLIGMYQKEAVRELMPALSGRPFAALGLSQAEADVTLAFARQAMDDPKVHRYFNYYFWFAQRPV